LLHGAGNGLRLLTRLGLYRLLGGFHLSLCLWLWRYLLHGLCGVVVRLDGCRACLCSLHVGLIHLLGLALCLLGLLRICLLGL
jgi:hypothetical protein